MEIDPFCKIINRELPAEILYEDDATMAFLDISPTAPGHTLVIPKKHAVNIFDVDESSLSAVMKTVQKVSKALMSATNAGGVHINSNHGEKAGQIVFHLHFHIIPRHERNEFVFWPAGTYNPDEGKSIAEKVREQLL